MRERIKALLVSALLVPFAATAMASAANPCTATMAGSVNYTPNVAGSKFQVAGNVASGTVVVSGPAGCTQTVSMTSWSAPVGSPNFRPFSQQTLVAKETRTFGVGSHTMSIRINNNCMYQVDMIHGAVATNNGNADYSPNVMMGFIQAGSGVCPGKTSPPVTTTTTPPPTPTPTPPAAPTLSQTQNQSQVVNVQNAPVASATSAPAPAPAPAQPAQAVQTVAAAQPAALPNTGPGSIAAIFAATVAVGTVAYQLVVRRHLNQA